jgi:hypothetical protein
MLKKDERWSEDRLLIVLNDKEIKTIFPNTERVGLNLIEDIAGEQQKKSM